MKTESTNPTTAKDILIAEDSRAQAEILSGILSQKGYGVTVAENGLEGLYKLMEMRPHLIISDVWMPKMDGYEFCRAVKNDVSLQHIPLVLLTSLSGPGNLLKGLEAGADYFITKPYSEDVLLAKIEAIFSEAGLASKGSEKVSVEVALDGEIHRLDLEPQKILNFFLATYENLHSHSQKLTHTKRELKRLNERLEEIVQQKTRSLNECLMKMEKVLGATVTALSTTIELRDPYTSGHQKRVAHLASAIAQEMGIPEGQRAGILVMGFLHDIGKITIPAEILSKPGKLNCHEMSLIKSHPQVGFDILKNIEFPWPVHIGVYQHHEVLDGSGYPQGLAREEIIMEARILAVADVVEAMVSHRPYRPALGIEAALGQIRANRDILYDGHVVDACLNLLNGGYEI